MPLLAASKSNAATTEKLSRIIMDKTRESQFLNYDFTEENHSRQKVDWGVDLIFSNHSTVNTDKAILHRYLPHGSKAKQHAYMDDGTGWEWDQDGGVKQHTLEPFGNAVHIRIYGPPKSREREEHLFARTWGFYNFGTAHIDHEEGNFLGNEWSGYSEHAETIAAKIWQHEVGAAYVGYNVKGMGNAQHSEGKTGHIWDNDGFATVLIVPEEQRESTIAQ